MQEAERGPGPVLDQVVAGRGRRRRAAHRRQLPQVRLARACPRPPEESLRAVGAVTPVAPARQAVQAGLPQVGERPADGEGYKSPWASFVNRSHSRQFVAPSVYRATLAPHLAVQLYHDHTNRHTNKCEGDSLDSVVNGTL